MFIISVIFLILYSVLSLESELLRISATILIPLYFLKFMVALNINVILKCRQNQLVVLWLILWLTMCKLNILRKKCLCQNF